MRSSEDIIVVRFETMGSVSLDLERMEEDGVWQRLLDKYDARVPAEKARAVAEYLTSYLRRESLFERVPSTNGPADLFSSRVECVTQFEEKEKECLKQQ